MARLGQSTTSTELADIIPTLIAPEITLSAARQEVFRPRCREFNLSGVGGAHDVATSPSISFDGVTEGTEHDEVQFDTGKRTITPILRGLDVVVGMKAWTDAQLSPQDAVIKEVAVALATDRDSRAAALYTEAPAATPDHEIGTDGTEFSFTTLRDGMALLYTQNAPKRFAWCMNGGQWIELLKDDTMINFGVKGEAVLTKGMGNNGYVTSVLDVDIYVTDQIDASSGNAYQSMMFSDKAAIGYGYKTMSSPLSPGEQELLVDIEYISAARAYGINCTYHADFEGIKGTSTTTNNWLVAIVS
jgi:hypothetical protein